MSALTAAQRSSWTERGFFRIAGFAPARDVHRHAGTA